MLTSTFSILNLVFINYYEGKTKTANGVVNSLDVSIYVRNSSHPNLIDQSALLLQGGHWLHQKKDEWFAALFEPKPMKMLR